MKALYLVGALAGAVIPYVPLIAAMVLIIFVIQEGKRLRVPGLWLPVAATCLVGVSCGLPLFLYLRERRMP